MANQKAKTTNIRMKADELAKKLSSGKHAWRPNSEDQEIIVKLAAKNGIYDVTQIIRQALRRSLEAEQVKGAA